MQFIAILKSNDGKVKEIEISARSEFHARELADCEATELGSSWHVFTVRDNEDQ